MTEGEMTRTMRMLNGGAIMMLGSSSWSMTWVQREHAWPGEDRVIRNQGADLGVSVWRECESTHSMAWLLRWEGRKEVGEGMRERWKSRKE